MKINGVAVQILTPARKVEVCFENLKEIETLVRLPVGATFTDDVADRSPTSIK